MEKKNVSQVWQHTPVIPANRKLRQEDHKLEVSLSQRDPSFKIKTRASKMAQPIKELPSKPDNISSTPYVHIVEPTYQSCPMTYTQTLNIIII